MITRLLVVLGAVSLLATGVLAENVINLKKPGLFGGTFAQALDGYDTVSYHLDGKPVRGDSRFSTEYLGASWYFATQENLDLFVADPDRYRPRYGGYCAWATARGYTAAGDPQVWSIVDDKLYLNYDKSVEKKWLKDIAAFIALADENWPGILEK